LFLLLDGVLSVEVDGTALGEVGPGAILGERAIVEDGRRTATLRAITKARVAVAAADQVDLAALATVSETHRRQPAPGEGDAGEATVGGRRVEAAHGREAPLRRGAGLDTGLRTGVHGSRRPHVVHRSERGHRRGCKRERARARARRWHGIAEHRIDTGRPPL